MQKQSPWKRFFTFPVLGYKILILPTKNVSLLMCRTRHENRSRMYILAKNTRVALSIGLGVVAFVAATSVTTGIAVNAGWICKIQIINLILSASIPMLAVWGIVTYVLGRVYCSSVCPLGTMMDVASYISRHTAKRGNKFHYRQPNSRMRALSLIIMGIGIVMGNAIIVTLLDPFFDFSTVVEGAVIPACTLGAAATGAATTIEGIIILLIVMISASRGGRLLCNTMCPAGNALGMISRHSIMRMDINTDLCTGCLKCVEVCKSSCIDPSSHTIDSSRCVMCMNCAAACPNKAITYTSNRHRLQKPLMAT